MPCGRTRYGLCHIEDVHNAYKNFQIRYKVVDLARLRSKRGRFRQRVRCFIHKGTTCKICGLEAAYYAIERNEGAEYYYLTLYGVKDGKEIEFTLDHIYPTSLGGPSTDIRNHQTLCMPCNSKKSNKVPG